ncbi:hypothetical protein CDAR_369021 [Caerostris darwini]|uniref:Uncharacterized protein n=1 Tax=Caerostris darwini TaxID=1538125 RepID=A0AAV4PGA3_9ARAC|nr:hypothetical protein CDAR_369021 [Caerostris darwini]
MNLSAHFCQPTETPSKHFGRRSIASLIEKLNKQKTLLGLACLSLLPLKTSRVPFAHRTTLRRIEGVDLIWEGGGRTEQSFSRVNIEIYSFEVMRR